MADETDTSNLDRGDEVKSPLDTAGKVSTPEVPKTPEAAAPIDDKLTEGPETPEEKAEREREEEEERKRNNIRIPKYRLDQVQQKARDRELALLAEIEKLKGGQQTSMTQRSIAEHRSKISDLQDKYEDLLQDGKKDEARAVRRQVEEAREQLLEIQTNAKSDATRTATIDELTFNAQLANLESTYPILNPDHADFDKERTDEVAALLEALVKTGESRTKALARAVKYVVGAPPEQRTSDAAKTLAEERAKQARQRAAEADKKQPPSSGGVGVDSNKAGKGGDGTIDVMRLTPAKFAALDDETLARLRGDTV